VREPLHPNPLDRHEQHVAKHITEYADMTKNEACVRVWRRIIVSCLCLADGYHHPDFQMDSGDDMQEHHG
jgi:hypothetical protein